MNDQTEDPAKIHRELYNRSRDIIAVKNPTNKDYRVIFDMRYFVVPAIQKDIGHGKGVATLQRYLAEKYVREMTNLLLSDRSRDLVNKQNEMRSEKGMLPLTKYPSDFSEESVESTVQINQIETRRDIVRVLWLGIVEKAPEDLYLQQQKQAPDPTKTADDMIFKDLDSIVYKGDTTPTVEKVDIEAKKEEFINSITQNDTQTANI